MTVTVRAFARLRELLGERRDVTVGDGARAGDIWSALPDAAFAFRGTTRIARNGSLVNDEEPLLEGDEIALLPPVSGG